MQLQLFEDCYVIWICMRVLMVILMFFHVIIIFIFPSQQWLLFIQIFTLLKLILIKFLPFHESIISLTFFHVLPIKSEIVAKNITLNSELIFIIVVGVFIEFIINVLFSTASIYSNNYHYYWIPMNIKKLNAINSNFLSKLFKL